MAERPEARDIEARNVAAVAGVLVLVIALVIAVCLGLVEYWRGRSEVGSDAPATLRDAARRAQPSAPQPERQAFFAEKNRLLNSWQWLDRRAGTARIPIDVAMEAMATRASAAKERRP